MRSSYGAARKVAPGDGYTPPTKILTTNFDSLLEFAGRNLSAPQADRTRDLFRAAGAPELAPSMPIYHAGDLELLKRRCVAVVGTREVSAEGAARARRLAREFVEEGIVVVSGLARGVDTEAHTSAIEADGRTIAVIGTPLDKSSPAQNRQLQEQIYREHLLISPFSIGTPTQKSHFPRRNRVMAAISDATVIVEASDISGTLHQAWECVNRGRWLFILKTIADNPDLEWPKTFLRYPNVAVLDKTDTLLGKVYGHQAAGA